MKSKSPFAKKSPLKIQVYRGDTYESPDTVITKTVGEQVGAAITGLADNAVNYMNTRSERDSSGTIATHGLGGGEYKGFGGGIKEINLPETPDVNTNLTDKGFGRFTESNVNKSSTKVPDLVNKGKAERGIKTVNGKKILTHEANADKLGYKKSTKERSDFIDASTKFNLGKYKTDTPTDDGKTKNYINMNGSPVKHNAGAVGSVGNADPLAGGIAGIGQRISNQAQQRAAKSQQSGSGIFGTIAQAAIQGGSAVGSIGQQMGNQAQQRAADAGGSTGVDPFLPPPNQVAETGSYGGGGDRILEMDSNPVGNQSIGRDTDITSQLFGSGQRASMLAMKGTPLHDKGHPNDYEGHTHRKKGASYKEGDYMDETDMETSYPKLHTRDVGEIKRDKKSQFMVSKNEDYNPTKIDTIRPLKGKEFKMGWGDAERNIPTNPKYKKSK